MARLRRPSRSIPSRKAKSPSSANTSSCKTPTSRIYEALTHAGAAHDCRVEIVRVDSSDLEDDGADKHLAGVSGVLIPGGFGDRGTEGKILAAQFARENGIPYLGLCLGMQIAAIEFARNVCASRRRQLHRVRSRIHPTPSSASRKNRQGVTDMGATMRLGTCVSDVKPGTKTFDLYQSATISERHRHRYEFNNNYREQFEAAGLTIAATSPDVDLVEVVEIHDHPFYVACQYHPEFLSKLSSPHPLFRGFVQAALKLSSESANPEPANT